MMKKILNIFILLIFIIFNTCLFASVVMKVEPGYNSLIKQGEIYPVRIEIVSYNEPFSGKLVLKTLEVYSNRVNDIHIKKIDFQGSSGRSRKVIYMYTDIYYYYISVKLYDDEDKVVAESVYKNMGRQAETERPQLLDIVSYSQKNKIVLLVDNSDYSFSIDPVVIEKNKRQNNTLSNRTNKRHRGSSNNKSIDVKVITIPPENLPDHYLGYKMVDCIILKDITSQEFKNYVENSGILEWVKLGGKLILLPDHSYLNYKKSFISKLLPFNIDGYSKIHLTSEFLTKYNFIFDTNKTIPGVQLSLKENLSSKPEAILDDRNNVIIGHVEKGLGNIFVFAPDINDDNILDFLKTSNKFWQDKFSDISPTNVRHNYITKLYELMNKQFFKIKHPGLVKVLLFLILFILLIAPVNYFILKRMNQEIKLWITIPMISIVFSIFAYIWNIQYQENNIFKYCFEYSVMKSGSSEKQIFQTINFQSPLKQNLQISTLPGFSLDNLQLRNRKGANYYYEDSIKIKDYFITSKGKAGFMTEGIKSTEGTVRVAINKYEDFKKSQKNSYNNYYLSNKKINVTVFNAMPEKIENSFIYYDSSLYKIGDIESGMKRTLDLYPVNIYVNNNFKNLVIGTEKVDFEDINNFQRVIVVASIIENDNTRNYLRNQLSGFIQKYYWQFRYLNILKYFPVNHQKPILCGWLKNKDKILNIESDLKQEEKFDNFLMVVQ